MKEKNKVSKPSSRVGRPLVYPNLHEIAGKFVTNNDSFDTKGWRLQQTGRKVILHGRYHLRDDNGTIIEMVPFRIMFPRFDMNPVENLTIKFSSDDHIRYIRKRFKKQKGAHLHEHIKGLFYEQIEELKPDH